MKARSGNTRIQNQPRKKLLMLMNACLVELAQKGGKQKFIALYGAAHAYTKQRRDEILAAKPRISKLQIAKIIHEEAENLAEFRVMSKENRERTIYDWVRKM
jgi:hypothetical protein